MNLLAHSTGRTSLFTALYFSEGAPIGLIWWALPTLLRTENIGVGQITGLTAMLVLPWSLKFLWAPLVDTMRTPRWGFRAWIVTAQIAMGLTLIPLVWLDPATEFAWWRLLLLAHAIAAATQDVAIDALAINVVPQRERGMLNGCMQAGMLIGRSAFGAGALLVAASAGREWILVALIVCIWSSLGLVLATREPAGLLDAKRPLAEFLVHLRGVAKARGTWRAMGFALIGAAAFESAGQLAGPFLVDRGVSDCSAAGSRTAGVARAAWRGLPPDSSLWSRCWAHSRSADRPYRTRRCSSC
jgi:PAT family beta-lactamase induction signal transducer AmpG